jgi:hypothetical protein
MSSGEYVATFRRTNLKNRQSITAAFPMLNDEDWNESPLFKFRCVSISNKWLFETEAPNAFAQATKEQEVEWQSYFDQFHIQVIEKFKIYMLGRRKGIFKEIVSIENAAKKLSGFCFNFYIPEIKVIYLVTFDFTAHIYFQDFDLAKELFELVENSKLAFLNDPYG